ncbi:MAG: MBL fold metallo-hydrolase [Saprospiraceae bacterium]
MRLLFLSLRHRLLTTTALLFLFAAVQISCSPQQSAPPETLNNRGVPSEPFVVVLGIAQDAGYPQADCRKACCRAAWLQPALRRMVSCVAVVDPTVGQAWMIDATPDFKDQLYRLRHLSLEEPVTLAGIFLTHAHIGHYTGLIHLGREAMGVHGMPVYAMPRMRTFLEKNGPWNQLVGLKNVVIRPLQADSAIVLNEQLRITPVPVPHRDEFSETVGYKIEGPEKSLLFIPDIDKWDFWEQDILAIVKTTDYALLDGSFYQNGEIPGRDMSEIPHPFIVESMERFSGMTVEEKAKVRFIHFNHTNPVLLENSEARSNVLDMGFGIAEELEIFGL